MITKATIKHNFSRHATRYDGYCHIQQRAAQELLMDPSLGAFSRILDIGCGTGNLTQRLRERYPSAKIGAIDLCPNMVALAREKSLGLDIEFQVGDAELGDLGGPYDLIASNAAIQWFSDFEHTIGHCLSHLEPAGVLLFSIFGPETYRELATTLAAVLQEALPLSSAVFVDEARVTACLQGCAGEVRVRREIVTQSYPNLMALLKTIKYSGTQGRGLPGRALSREQIHALDRYYQERYGGIVASHEILYCWAQRGPA